MKHGDPSENLSLLTRHDIVSAGTFVLQLPRFLHRRLEIEQAKVILRERFEQREQGFLSLVKRFIFEYPSSPYCTLFRHAGCTFEDVENLVREEGIEGTLEALLRTGIYFRVEEYKGRTPVRRGSLEFWASPEAMHNPCSKFHVPARSSGSRSPGTPVSIDLGFISDCAVNCLLMLSTRGQKNWRKADWEVAGGGAFFRLLKFSQFGSPPVRWFSQLDPCSPGLHSRYRWSARALRWGSLFSGVPLPNVEHVPLENPLPIARWMREETAGDGSPCLFTFPSSAVTVCLAAEKRDLSLVGASFIISGEPITQARMDVITRTGADVITRYGTIECGPIGYGCLNPGASDDLHLNHDLHAVIQAGDEGQSLGVPDEALFLTTLRPTAPFIFLNVCMGDQAVLSDRECGCAMERLGWKRHARFIRSFEKLTGAGMTFMDTDIIRVLEEVLPFRFGGAPTDYQLLEEEGENGEPILRLLVRPEIGPIDEHTVADVFLDSLSRGSGVEKVMGMTWREAGILKVERRSPLTTHSGKILHLFLKRQSG